MSLEEWADLHGEDYPAKLQRETPPRTLTKKDLEFCLDEILGELGWCDEIEETGVDPLDFARDEIKSLQRHARRVNRPLVSQDALYLASVWDTLVESGYLTEEFINNHVGVVSAATLASKTLAQMAASDHKRLLTQRAPDVCPRGGSHVYKWDGTLPTDEMIECEKCGQRR